MKLRNNRGETLVEVLAAIVIASLSVAMLFGCIVGSSSLDKRAREVDGPYYENLSAAEVREETLGQEAKVAITKNPPPDTTPTPVPDVEEPITIYGKDGVFSYTIR